MRGDRRPHVSDGQGVDRPQTTLGNLEGVGAALVRQQHCELFATQASHQIDGPTCAFAQCGCHPTQQAPPAGWP